MKKYFTLISALADKHITPSTYIPSNKDIYVKSNEIACPSAYNVEKALIFLSACFNSFSAYYKSPLILGKTLDSLTKASKHADKGSYEPESFCISVINASNIYRLAKTYTKILSACDKPEGLALQKTALGYIEKAKDVLLNLKTDSVYLYAAMTHVAKDLKDESLKQTADYIKESIQGLTSFSDRYINTLCDIYRESKDKKFLKAAENNITSVLKLIEPDDTVIIIEDEKENLKNRKPSLYLEDYLDSLIYISSVTKDDNLEKAISYAFKALAIDENPNTDENKTLLLIPSLVLLNARLLDMEFMDISRKEGLSSFNGSVKEAGIYRHGTGSYISQTIFQNQDIFYSIQCGALKARLRLNATFFGPKGRFMSDRIEKTEKGFRLHYEREWGYFLPLEDRSIPPIVGSDVNKDDREMTNLQYFDVDVNISLKDDGADITMTLSRIDDLACKLDIIFDKQGFFDSDYAAIHAAGNDYIQLQKGYFTYTLGSDYIKAGPGFNGSSVYSETLRGSNLPIEGTFTVYFTDMTPSSHTISIRGGRA